MIRTVTPSTSSQGGSHPTRGDSCDKTMIHDTSACSDDDERVAVSISCSIELAVFSANQLLPDHSEQEGIHGFPRTMIASTSPARGVFELVRFTNHGLN